MTWFKRRNNTSWNMNSLQEKACDLCGDVTPEPPTPCCGLTAWNYFDNFSPGIVAVTPTGEPNEYTVEFRGLAIRSNSNKPLFLMGLFIVDNNTGGVIYENGTLATTEIPEVITVTAMSSGGNMSLRVVFQGYNSDGLLALNQCGIIIPDGEGPAEVFAFTGISLDNTDCTAPFYTVTPRDPEMEFTQALFVVPDTTYVDRYQLFVDGDTQVAVSSNADLGALQLGSFLANCEGEIKAEVLLEFDCDETLILIRGAYVFGLTMPDAVYLEYSLNGTVWSLLFAFTFANFFSVEAELLFWDKADIPEDTLVYYRVRSANRGVLYESSILSPDCDPQMKFYKYDQSFGCDTGLSGYIWNTCWAWSEIPVANDINMEYSLDGVNWSLVGNLIVGGPVSEAPPGQCFDIRLDDFPDLPGNTVYIRFINVEASGDGELSEVFTVDIPPDPCP